MKICFVGPGTLPIPPKGWGALETVLWNQHEMLKNMDVEVCFVNELDHKDTLDKILAIDPDIVHLHYGEHYQIMPYIKCRKIKRKRSMPEIAILCGLTEGLTKGGSRHGTRELYQG